MKMFDIDFVVTYVDSKDPSWFKDYMKYAKEDGREVNRNSVRFRSWDTLKYQLRGIETYMPWIRNVYLIVSSESQVPDFINTETVHVITHDMIIPEKYLPTFNSNTIELFMYKIEGLSEHFIYSNDDIYAIGDLKPEDFFTENGDPKVIVRERIKKYDNIYIQTISNTRDLCLLENKKKLQSNLLLRSDHSMNPMLKSTWEMYWKKYKDKLENSISTFRTSKNISQEISNYHHYLSAPNIHGVRRSKYFQFKNESATKFYDVLFSKDFDICCMNDANVLDFNLAKRIIISMFRKKHPNKSKYEN